MAESVDNSVHAEKVSHTYDTFDDPLFLSNSDQPMLQLVGYQFEGKNFLHWKRDVYLALVAKNKEGFIDGSTKTPPKTDKTYHQWVRCDLMVMKWILNSVSKDIRETLVYVGNSKDLWTELLDRYGQTNSVEIYQLKKDLVSLTQDNDTLVEYFSKHYNKTNFLWRLFHAEYIIDAKN
ncbi:hypothetical protein RND81_04G138200 [Saponaria officinalis]|uniref:Retrotransposon Copia-like N-terminal domain-containing protein n=1 Tax=Saponaria officinalis TaxID=3572 RepID=A0AAW1LKX8_SAPOF